MGDNSWVPYQSDSSGGLGINIRRLLGWLELDSRRTHRLGGVGSKREDMSNPAAQRLQELMKRLEEPRSL